MPIPKVPIEKINKMPLAYALMIVGGLLGIFATKYFDKNTEIVQAYKDKDAAREIYIKSLERKCDSVAGFWQNKYLVSLERAQDLQRKQDSTNTAILTKPNRDLLRALKNKKR